MGVSPHLLCIQYTIFTGWCKFLSDFFVAAGGLALPAAFRGPNFYKKISRAMMHSQRPSTLTNPLLPQLQFNTKYVKLQVISYAFSIPYFLPNATAKPQNLPAVHYLGDVCIHTTKAYIQSTVASRVIVVRGLVNPPRLIRFREYRRDFQTPHELSFMPATLGRSGFLTTDTAQTQ